MKNLILTIALMFTALTSAYGQADDKYMKGYNMQCGSQFYDAGDYSKSLEFFEAELRDNPKNGYAMTYISSIFYINSMFGKAMEFVDMALQNLPKKDKQFMSGCYELKGDISIFLSDTLKALDCYSKAFKISRDTETLNKKCNTLISMERYDEAEKELHKSIKLAPSDPLAWVYLARIEVIRSNYDTALSHLDHALMLDPNCHEAYTMRTLTYCYKEMYNEACLDFIQSVSSNFADADKLNFYNLATSEPELLSLHLKAQHIKDSGNAYWLYLLAIARSYISDYEGTVEACTKALEFSACNEDLTSGICQVMCDALTPLGRFDEAEEYIERAQRIDSASVSIQNSKADLYFWRGDIDKAIEIKSAMADADPVNPSNYYDRSLYYSYDKKLPQALADISTALTIDGENVKYLLQRAMLYHYMKKNDLRDDDCRTLIQKCMSADDNESLLILGYADAMLGNKEIADSLLAELISDSTSVSAETEYNAACICSLNGDVEKALQHLEAMFRKNSTALFFMTENSPMLSEIRATEQYGRLLAKYAPRDNAASKTADEGSYEEQTTEVPFTKENGICKVKCSINGLPLHFYFDTGASDVTLSSVEAMFMLKNGYLSPSDLKGTEYYSTASGDVAEGTIVVLKNVNFGGFDLNNVKASIVDHQQAPLLLGQTLLSQLGKIEIDYSKNVLKITRRCKVEK